MNKKLVCILCGMIAIPKYILGRISARPTVFVAHRCYFYPSCATTTFLTHFKPCTQKSYIYSNYINKPCFKWIMIQISR